MTVADFERGHTYNRRRDIHGRFGGQRQGGNFDAHPKRDRAFGWPSFLSVHLSLPSRGEAP